MKNQGGHLDGKLPGIDKLTGKTGKLVIKQGISLLI